MADRHAARLLVAANRGQRAFLARRLAAVGLHAGQEQVLMRLWEKDGSTQSELLASLQCAAPTLTKAVQRLERAGLVRRERGGHPPVTRVYLTQPGQDLRRPVEDVWAAAEDVLASAMTPGQYDAMVVALQLAVRAFGR